MSKIDNNELWIFDAPTYYDFTRTEQENNHLGDLWFEQSNKPLSSSLLEFKKSQQHQQLLRQQKEEEHDLNINHDVQTENIQILDNSPFKYQQQQQQFHYTNDVYIHSPTHRLVPTKQRRDMKSEVLRYREEENESTSTIPASRSTKSDNHIRLKEHIQVTVDDNDNDLYQINKKIINNGNNDMQDTSEFSPILNGVPSEPSSMTIEPPNFDLKMGNTLSQNYDYQHIIHKHINNNNHKNDANLNKKRKEIQKEDIHYQINNKIGNRMDLNENDNIKKRKLLSINDNINEKSKYNNNNNNIINSINKNNNDHPVEKTLAQVLASVSSFSSTLKKKHPSSFPPLPLSPLRIKSNKYSSSTSTLPPSSPSSSSLLSLLNSASTSAYRVESVLERAKRVLQESHIKSRLWDSSNLEYNNNNHRFDIKNSLSSLRIMKQPKVTQRQSTFTSRKISHDTALSNNNESPEIDYLEYSNNNNSNNNNNNNRSNYGDEMDILLNEDENNYNDNEIEVNNLQSSLVSYWSTPYLPINLTKPRSPKFHTDKRSRY